MIVGRQIRAARALLDMSQEQLAEATGLTPQAIRKIENGDVHPREGTVADIRRVFHERGLEFTDNQGVRFLPQGIQIYEGRDGLISLMEDVYDNCRRGVAGEVVLSGVSESDFQKHLGAYDDIYLAKMKSLPKIHMRHLIAEGDFNVVSSEYSEYRWTPRDQFKAVPFYVYADKLAIILFSSDPPPKIFLIQSVEVADAYRRQFDSMWAQAKELPVRKDLE